MSAKRIVHARGCQYNGMRSTRAKLRRVAHISRHGVVIDRVIIVQNAGRWRAAVDGDGVVAAASIGPRKQLDQAAGECPRHSVTGGPAPNMLAGRVQIVSLLPVAKSAQSGLPLQLLP